MSQDTKAAKRAGDLLLKSVEIEHEADDESPATVDVDAIKCPLRQEILFYVAESDSPVPRERLAEHLTTWMTESYDGPVSEAEYEQTHALVLHHKHLPQLTDAGLIEYDQRNMTVALTEYANKLIDA